MSAKRIVILAHARFEMRRRGITQAQLEAVIRSPDQIIPSRKGRQIYQSKISRGRMLLRVVVKTQADAYHVVTAYLTNKVAKYWRKP